MKKKGGETMTERLMRQRLKCSACNGNEGEMRDTGG